MEQSGTTSYWPVIEDFYNSRVNIYDGPDAYLNSIVGAPRCVVLLHAAHMCQSEVHNGGFLQLLWNGTGVLAPEAAEGFTAMGMPKAASLVFEAVGFFEPPYPRDRDERWDYLLAASGREQADIEEIFKGAEDFYTAFVEVTETLPIDELNEQFWECMKTESGGFDAAATRYAQSYLASLTTSCSPIVPSK